MKKIVFLLLFVCISLAGWSQENYWQQKISYAIDVELNEQAKSLSGFQTIVYTNNSPSTLDFIWFHIWPNAYKNNSTALFSQIRNDKDRSKKLTDYTYGSMEGLTFQTDGKNLSTEMHPNPQYIDIIKVKLPEPLKSGESVKISSSFTVKLPSYFSRSGFADGEFMITQWYPKPAVFDKTGWHEFPYLDMGEFYSEYADYNVTITLPSSFVVGATGQLLTTDELAAYKLAGKKNTASRSGTPAFYKPLNNSKTKTLNYSATNVPDFAWFADKDLLIQYDTLRLASGKVIDAFTYYHNKKNTLWNQSIDYVKNACRYYSKVVGEYEYPVVQAIEGPANNSSGGMEYPMITLITSPDAKKETLDGVITHEVGHNWFMSMLGSNERAHTWMDEGLNTYIQFRYEAEKYRGNSMIGDNIPENIKSLPAGQFLNVIYGAFGSSVPLDSPIDIPADQFKTSDEYGLISYFKTAIWLHMLESTVGQEKMDAALQNYFRLWKHKHPQPADMKAAFEQSLGINLDDYFQLLNKKGQLGAK